MTVGLIGLGALGSAIATALIAGGCRPTGYDRDAGAIARFGAAGGTPAASAAELCRTADCVIVVLRDEQQIDDLLAAPDGPTEGMQTGATLWLVSTVRPSFTAQLGATMLQRGIHLLDGPVSGGVELARTGRLTLILAGDDTAFASGVIACACPGRPCLPCRRSSRPGFGDQGNQSTSGRRRT